MNEHVVMTEEEIAALRRSGFALAYRMLGSVSDAEDVVQEGLLRLFRSVERGEQIQSTRAYLSTVVTRLALDQLRSARVRRESYVGDWLPEPLVTGAEANPAHRLEMSDSLSLAFLVLLESLSPQQRAAFLLREVFDEPYARIAQIIDTSEQNVRQLVTRARRHVHEGCPRYDTTPEQRDRLADRFFAAADGGDLEALEQLLAHDVVLHADSGGKAPAIRRAVNGRSRVARLLANGLRARTHLGEITSRREQVNGQPGAMFFDHDGRLASIVVLGIAGHRVQAVSIIVNPDKMRHLGPVADLGALLRDRR